MREQELLRMTGVSDELRALVRKWGIIVKDQQAVAAEIKDLCEHHNAIAADVDRLRDEVVTEIIAPKDEGRTVVFDVDGVTLVARRCIGGGAWLVLASKIDGEPSNNGSTPANSERATTGRDEKQGAPDPPMEAKSVS